MGDAPRVTGPKVVESARSTRSGTAARTVVIVGIVTLFASGVFLVWQTRTSILLLFAGLLFGLFLGAIADWVHEHVPIPRGVALGLVIAVLFGLLGAAFWLRGPVVAEQIGELRERLPRAAERLRERVAQYDLGRRALNELPEPDDLLPDRSEVVNRATGLVTGLTGAFASVFVVVLFGIFVAAQPSVYLGGLMRLVPTSRRDRVREALLAAGDAVRLWLLSKTIRMVFIGIVTWVALHLLGVPVAFLLALIAALLAFIPNFGPIIAAVPAILLALVQGLDTALWVALLYLAIQFVEGNVLDPVLTKTIVSVPPALTFAVQVLLGVLGGVTGLAVATPLTAAGVVLVRRLYVEQVIEQS